MVSKMSLSICFAVFFVEITNCNGNFNVVSQLPSVNQCGTVGHKVRVQSQLECAKRLDALNQELFDCQFLNCKLKFSRGRLGFHFARLRCVRRVCGSHTSQPVCKHLAICDGEKEKEFGLAKFIVCVENFLQSS